MAPNTLCNSYPTNNVGNLETKVSDLRRSLEAGAPLGLVCPSSNFRSLRGRTLRHDAPATFHHGLPTALLCVKHSCQ